MKAARKLVVFILALKYLLGSKSLTDIFMLQSVDHGKIKFVKNFFGRDKGEELKTVN